MTISIFPPMDLSGKKCNFFATAAPTSGDDELDGWAVGSFWFDISGGSAYVCLDATASTASWIDITSSTSGDVVGPASSTDEAVVRWNSTTGKLLQDSANGPFVADAGHQTMVGRMLEDQGADVASANDLTLGADGNTFEITGTTQINALTIANWQNGSSVTLLFTSTPTVKHNTAGGAGTAVILLAGSADFSATAGSNLTLRLCEIGGTQAWREIGRMAP